MRQSHTGSHYSWMNQQKCSNPLLLPASVLIWFSFACEGTNQERFLRIQTLFFSYRKFLLDPTYWYIQAYLFLDCIFPLAWKSPEKEVSFHMLCSGSVLTAGSNSNKKFYNTCSKCITMEHNTQYQPIRLKYRKWLQTSDDKDFCTKTHQASYTKY